MNLRAAFPTARIVKNGVLEEYNPNNHVYVYLYEGILYWVVEDGFKFEADGTTCIELVLCTTETEKLSEQSRGGFGSTGVR